MPKHISKKSIVLYDNSPKPYCSHVGTHYQPDAFNDRWGTCPPGSVRDCRIDLTAPGIPGGLAQIPIPMKWFSDSKGIHLTITATITYD